MQQPVRVEGDARVARVEQQGLRIVRGLSGSDRDDLLACWTELWRGAVQSHQLLMDVEVNEEGEGLSWIIKEREA